MKNLVSPNTTSFVILGGGQHAFLLHALATKLGLKLDGWVDKSTKTKFVATSDFRHFTEDSDLLDLTKEGVGLIPGIASHKLWGRRNALIREFAKSVNINPNIQDERAIISEGVNLGEGIQFIGNCFVQRFTQIGSWSIMNSGSVVEHDSIIGDFVHIAPGVTICGGVSIGSGSYIGAGTTIVEGVTVGENALIGAGSLVLKDVPAGDIQFGAPSSHRGSVNG